MCRRSGLEIRRRCAWLGIAEDTARPVWIRKKAVLGCCPESFITAESESLVEEYFVRKRLGGLNFEELSARQVEAFVILEQALGEERSNGQHNTRRDL
uniref:Uncharacterized protein n=1 Tax=Solibacter usitatus (strain Ellin6076) TaxID=234267 RepID=Q01Z34_SOLUE